MIVHCTLVTFITIATSGTFSPPRTQSDKEDPTYRSMNSMNGLCTPVFQLPLTIISLERIVMSRTCSRRHDLAPGIPYFSPFPLPNVHRAASYDFFPQCGEVVP